MQSLWGFLTMSCTKPHSAGAHPPANMQSTWTRDPCPVPFGGGGRDTNAGRSLMPWLPMVGDAQEDDETPLLADCKWDVPSTWVEAARKILRKHWRWMVVGTVALVVLYMVYKFLVSSTPGRLPLVPHGPARLTQPGNYDLRLMKGSTTVGCEAPISKFPGQQKYGCGGAFATPESCDSAPYPIKKTKYVAAVHAGCETASGHGTYGYAYDDGVGLKQCAPMTRYDWILCPEGSEASAEWEAAPPVTADSTRRFRVTNKCAQPIWIQQAGVQIPGEPVITKIEQGSSYAYSIPNKGLSATRFLPKIGCDAAGNNCLVQSMPPCPPTGCDQPLDTKFEASWGCKYATLTEQDKTLCTLTAQGNPSTYQDWWDGSAVDGWTLPFSVIVSDADFPLAPNVAATGRPEICGDVVCAKLTTELCPTDEFLTP